MAYLLGCIFMGLGIGMDVFIATFVRAFSLTTPTERRRWVVLVTSTHALFPMIGYFGFVYLIVNLPLFKAAFGIIAFFMIAWFLTTALRDWISKPEVTDVSEGDKIFDSSLPLILAISMDALWSGPGKSAQAVDWDLVKILLSFPLSATVVGVLALSGLYLGRKTMCRAVRVQQNIAAWRLSMLQFVEFLVIGYFGYLSLFRLALNIDNQLQALLASLFTTLVIFGLFWKKVLAKNVFTLQVIRAEIQASAAGFSAKKATP